MQKLIYRNHGSNLRHFVLRYIPRSATAPTGATATTSQTPFGIEPLIYPFLISLSSSPRSNIPLYQITSQSDERFKNA